VTISTGPILVVEDIAAVRELIDAQLTLRGYRVVTARDGYDALCLLETIRPAVVVTDVLMPRMDGFALAHRLRADPRTAGLPIIFLSATYVSAEDERFALDLGAQRFLPKPVDADELFIAVADALTGQGQAGPALAERDFFIGYRQRLETKLRQKMAQIARGRQHVADLTDDQRETYERLLAEAQEQHDEIQRELAVLLDVLRELG
jgi:CheY-like chemotaxis protein